jgi:glutathione S-transferase
MMQKRRSKKEIGMAPNEQRREHMADFILYGFGESGNAYKAALMLELCGLDYEVRSVDYFGGETRSEVYRNTINALGEVPVLLHKDKKLTQSGVILDYLADITDQYGARSKDERREILRGLLYDNHKFTSYVATLRFLLQFTAGPEPAVAEFLKQRVSANLKIVDGHLATRDFILDGRATIADLSMCGYMFFDGELGVSLENYRNIGSWLGRIKSLPRWKHPYSLLPRMYVR